jgi:NADH:ubiquinone oxidoreductase subunit
MTFKEYLLQAFTWWNGQTMGTRFYTWRFGQFVGEDEFGNRYYRYRQRQAIDPNVGNERRWVIYNGEAEISKVPPGWRGWLTHTTDVPPTEETYVPHPWEMAHIPNNTGTPHAYRPRGSIVGPGQRPAATGDYVPWTPNE